MDDPIAEAGLFADLRLPQDLKGASLYSELQRRLEPCVIKVIKNPDDTDYLPTEQYEDHAWRDRIINDMEMADLIVALPLWPSDAFQWEIQTIQRLGLLNKLTVLMPPARFSAIDLGDAWWAAKVFLGKEGLIVKRYRHDGGLFLQAKPKVFDREVMFSYASLDTLAQESPSLSAKARLLKWRRSGHSRGARL